MVDEGTTVQDEHGHGIHMPSPSYFPVVLAFGLPLMGYGVIFKQWWLVGIGLLVLLTGAYGWVLEPATAEE